MVDSKKLKERVDTVSKEMKERVNRLSTEVKELQGKLKKRFIGVGEEVEETAERLSQEAKKLKERVKDIVPVRKGGQPVRVRVGTKDEFLVEISRFFLHITQLTVKDGSWARSSDI